MTIKEVKLENTILCENCRSVYLVEDWTPTDILRVKCPKCRKTSLYWAVKSREDKINKEVEQYGKGR